MTDHPPADDNLGERHRREQLVEVQPGISCPSCGHTNRPHRRFCTECGRRLGRACAACGTPIEAEEKFCGNCGASLGEQVATARAPAAYTPPHLASRILAEQAAMESRGAQDGERKTITALFADIKGSVELMENMDPEDARAIVDPALQIMMDAVHRYEGYVAQSRGDGIFALFGAPIAHEDHPQRAIHAALRMQEEIKRYADKLRLEKGAGLEIRVGLNTGEVVVRSIRKDDLNADYVPIGHSTNLAARMESLATPGTILVSEDTQKLTEGYFDFRALGPATVKGITEPVQVYEVVRARGLRTRIDVEAERGLTPFVGRERELALLQDRWADAKAGAGQVALVMGDPGIGKSRLLLEFQRRLEGESATWLTGRCISYGKEMAYAPIIDVVKHNFQVEEGDDDATISAKIERGMIPLGEELRPAIPHVKHLLSVNPGDDAVFSMDAQQRRAKLFEAVRAMTLKGGQLRPLVILVEDLHWIDKTSEELLLYLADGIATARVLLLFTYRPGYQNPFGERTYVTRIVLHNLSAEESYRLVGGMLSSSQLPPELRDVIFRKAEGNPFFVEEVLKSLLETGNLRRDNGDYRLVKPHAELEIPDTIQDVIMARIDRLGESPKKALQLASVIGREFTVRLLDRISDRQAQLERFLQELKILEFIYERSFYPELAYMFKHALTHDVAYNSLLVQRRKMLHRLVGTAVEELYADRLPEYYEMLAYHYERGEIWEKALEYLVNAGQKAQQAYANEEALGHYDRALEVCKQLGNAVEPSTLLTLYAAKGTVHFLLSEFLPAAESYQHMLEIARLLGDGAREAEALYLIGNSFLWAHELEKALQHAEQVKALALAIGFKNSLAAGLYLVGKIHLVLGNLETSSRRFELEEARRCFEEALKLSEEAGDKLLEGFIRFDLVIYHGWKGDYDRALQFQEQATAIGQSCDLALVLLWTSWTGGLCYGGKGEYQKALASLQHALKLSEQLGDKVFKCRALNTLGWVYGELYDLETSLRYNQEAAEIAHELGDPELIRYAEINLGTDYLLLGDLDQAQQFLEKVHHACQQPGALGHEWAKHRYSQYLAHSLGELWLGRGDSTRALKFADECLRLAESNSAKKNLVKGLRLKGQALCAQRRMSDAEGAFTEALTIAVEIGNPPQLWKTHQALGEFRELQGELQEASSAYANAVRVIEEVASRLEDPALKRNFLSTRSVQQIRARLKALHEDPR